MSTLLVLVLIIGAYVVFRFVRHKSAMESKIQSQGGVDVIYGEFVDFFKQKGFRTRELQVAPCICTTEPKWARSGWN